MGNCCCRRQPSVYRVSSNAKSESPKDPNISIRARNEERRLPSNPEEVESLRRDSGANPLIAFTFKELKIMTENFRSDRMIGGGGFGCVYKGFVSEDLREGLSLDLSVAVKVHDGDNSHQGHREWLNLTDWALPMLKEKKKVLNIIDPRLDGDYPTKGAHKAAMLVYHCLNKNPKARPLMRDIVDSLEPLQLQAGQDAALVNDDAAKL